MAGLVFEADFEFVYESDEHLAVRQGGAVQVWDIDGRHCFGILPEKNTAVEVQAALRFWEQGQTAGRVSLAEDIRRMLGMV